MVCNHTGHAENADVSILVAGWQANCFSDEGIIKVAMTASNVGLCVFVCVWYRFVCVWYRCVCVYVCVCGIGVCGRGIGLQRVRQGLELSLRKC